MSQLVFFDDGHTYELDGVQIPSVSEVTRFLSREVYGDVQQFRLDHAASRGTKIHKLTEALDKYGEIEADAESLPYIKAYVKFRQEHDVQWEEIEKPRFHPDGLYAGTVDRMGTIDGRRGILDIKNSYRIHKPLYEAAQNLYRMTYDPGFIEVLYILHLKPDETYKLIELPIRDDLALACLTLHQATAKKRRKKKEETK